MILLANPYLARCQQKPEIGSQRTISHKPPLAIFDSVLPQIKARSHIPILLPSELPMPIAKAKHVVIGRIDQDEYGMGLFYELGVGDAGLAASFSARGKPKFHPQELPNVEPVDLARHLHGFFRAVSCGGSCAPANLWWEQGGVLYQIQLGLSPSLSDKDQQKAITAAADSAILAGPR